MPKFTFACFYWLDGSQSERKAKEHTHATSAGDGNIGPRVPHVKGIAQGTGQKCTGARGIDRSRLEPGGRRGEGGPASPHEPSPVCESTWRQRTESHLAVMRLKLLRINAFGRPGLPTAAILATLFQKLVKGREMAFEEQSLERGILKRAREALEASRNGLKSTSHPPEFDERRPHRARAQPEGGVRPGSSRRR